MRPLTGLMAILVALGLATAAGAQTGPNNAITDVPGILVGHDTKRHAATGTTVVFMPEGALVGASPSGGAPGNRVTTLLEGTYQDSLRTSIFGILLNGGSIFGLQAACGVVEFLQEQGLGLPFGGQTVPLVPGAIIFDLGRGGDVQKNGVDNIPKNCGSGYRAASNASDGGVAQGSVGAGTGARSGGLKGGVGTASTVMPDGTVIGALVVVNSAGRPYNPDAECELYALYLEQDDEFGSVREPPNGCGAITESGTEVLAPPGQATTIGVIATDARLTAAQVERMAQDSNDGFARAVRPAHTPGDGDTIFGVSTAVPNDVAGSAGVDGGTFRSISVEAADVYARAITHAIISAEGLGVAETYCERFPTACPSDGQSSTTGVAATAAQRQEQSGPTGMPVGREVEGASALRPALAALSGFAGALLLVGAFVLTRRRRELPARKDGDRPPRTGAPA